MDTIATILLTLTILNYIALCRIGSGLKRIARALKDKKS